MLRKKLFFIAIAVALALQSFAAEPYKREMRTAWIATVSNIDWPSTRGTSATVIAQQKKQLTDILDGFVAANMNSVCLQVRPLADAFYKSSYEPWSSYLTGTRGKDPGWDPLAFAVEECHKRGMECNAWVNPYRFSNSSGNDCNTAIDQEVKNSGILLQGKETNRLVFNPGLEASRQHLLKVCREIMLNYDIDGFIFDDYFYPGGGMYEDSQAPDYQLWKDSGTSMTIGDWRRSQVNLMVKEMWDMIQETKPYVKFSIGPAGVSGTKNVPSAALHGVDVCPVASDWQYNSIYSDPLAWLEEGTIDYISPQLYWKTNHSTNPFGPLTKWWSYVADHFNRHNYPSLNIYFMNSTSTCVGSTINDEDDWEEICQQIRYSRQYDLNGGAGVNFYSAKYVNGPACSGLGDYLVQNVFTTKSIPPAMTWHPRGSYGSPTNITFTSGKLSWTGVDKSLVRYSVYAVPSSCNYEQAKSTEFDGIKADYLLGTTYSPEYTIPEDKRSGYWYVVCVVDGWNYEYDPGFYGLATEYADKVDPLSPVNGTVVGWSQTFSWTSATAAKYRIQISEAADFSTLMVDNTGLTTNSCTLNMDEFESGKTYYWRVATQQSNKLDTWSDVATFTGPVRTDADAVALVSPANGAEMKGDFSFEFKPVTADSYTLQVSDASDFGKIVYETSTFETKNGNLTAPYVVSLGGKGTFYWRVITKRNHYNDKESTVRNFKVTEIPIGEYEPGYVMKLDVDANNYADANGLRLTNLWVRSSKSTYNNMTFENSGQLNRGMAVLGNRVYVAGRQAASSTAATYLQVYSGDTGEHLQDLMLGSDASVPYFPCNDVQTDNAGHLVISNLTLNAYTTPLVLHQVNPETAEITRLATIYYSGFSSSNRLDHIAIYGDVTSETFYVFAAERDASSIVRWTVTNGVVSATKKVSVTKFAPTSCTSFGTAPQLFAESADVIYVDSGAGYFTRYNMNTGACEGYFANGSDLAPENVFGNGGCTFMFNGKHHIFYSAGDETCSNGFVFNLAQATTGTDFANYNLLWKMPKRGLGTEKSSTWSAQCGASLQADGSMLLCVYAPGNGLAAYRLSTVPSYLHGDVNHDGKVDVADVSALINIILTGVGMVDEADVDGSGEVNVADVTTLINLILNA